MKLRNKENDFPIHISLIDTLFCTLTFIKIITAVAIIMIEPIESKEQKKDEKILLSLDGQLSIEAWWPKERPEDIDLWVIGPDKQPVGYSATRSGTLGYLRDDTGVESPDKNYELITAPGFYPGHYIVNLYYFATYSSNQRITVKVRVLFKKKEEATEVVYEGNVELLHVKQEKTVIQFDLELGGAVTNKSNEQKSIYQNK